MSTNVIAQQHLTLLVVAPDREILNLVKAVLTVHKHRILLAENEEDGFNLAKLERPDVIVATSGLDETGPSLCQRIRKEHLIGNTPFVILTTSGNTKTFATYFANGCDQVLPIPFKCSDIYDAIRLAHKKSEQENLSKIHVLLKSGLADFVDLAELNRLLVANEVLCFHRKDGVARIGHDPIRRGCHVNYSGTERRRVRT